MKAVKTCTVWIPVHSKLGWLVAFLPISVDFDSRQRRVLCELNTPKHSREVERDLNLPPSQTLARPEPNNAMSNRPVK
jgi:hypothetical protein